MQIVKGRLHNTGGPGLINSPFEDTAVSWRAGRLPRYQETRDESSSCADVELSSQRRESGSRRRSSSERKRTCTTDRVPWTRISSRRNVTEAEKKRSNAVDIKDIQAAQREMFQTPHMHLLEAASRHERIFLAALVMELRGVVSATRASRTSCYALPRATLQAV